MTPDGLARTHGAAFPAKGWPAGDFATYLASDNMALLGDDSCFVVLRLAGPEAEVLTLATHPDTQGQGRATAMLGDALAWLGARGVVDVFLDVAEDNVAARALYQRHGFTAFATRKNYYKNKTSAICMKRTLCTVRPDETTA